MAGPLELYEAKLRAGHIQDDQAQRRGLAALEEVYQRLTRPAQRQSRWQWWALGWRDWHRGAAAPSVYLHGPVGRGKSLVMDLFVEATQAFDVVERVHFHAFMLTIHQRIHALQRAGQRGDPIATLAKEMAARARVLCFDEFVVNNIADAMILGRLFEALWQEGLTLITTSNFAPQALYQDGLHRSRFEPFIARIEAQMQVIEVAGPRDYRLLHDGLSCVYFTPLDTASRVAFEDAYKRLAVDYKGGPASVSVGSRQVPLPYVAGPIAMSPFENLCARPLGAADYLALAERFAVLALDKVPILTQELRNEASRFKVLIDALYEAGTLLILRSAVDVAALHAGPANTEFSRTLSRLQEMRTKAYVDRALARLKA